MDTPRHRFNVGDRVRVRAENPEGNPRTPAYIKARTGVVSELHGVIENPIDHRFAYPPLCSVVFELRDVFGIAGGDRLSVDLHEDWLEPA